MRLERPLDLEVRREDSNYAIVTTKEQAIRSRAHTTDLVVLEESGALIVWRLDLAHFEEIERFPLLDVSSGPKSGYRAC
jgi:hypothetical protein